ncbi:MAG: hypothetical protein K2N85_02675, partial [Lachnospiraceae bacterium]|nr:hypothetical protein [Lachnospiraceae bacterium]
MLRFYHSKLEKNNDVAINDNSLIIDSSLWQNCRNIIQTYEQKQNYLICLFPIRNVSGELIAYGYQDNEANRERRMLKELAETEHALQFTDIFPEYKEVIIWGCNELAFFFAEYLKRLGIVVSVIGQYWDYYGYESCDLQNLMGNNSLIVYAEGIPLQNQDLYEIVKRSVSPEFECI